MSNRVRARREQLGLTQKELATHVAISRQTLNGIEADRQSPSVMLALRLARVLSTQVEALFGDAEAHGPQAQIPIDAALAGRLRGQRARVVACELRGRYVVHPMVTRGRVGHSWAADGIASASEARRGRVRVQLAASLDQVRENLVIAGAEPGLSVLCEHLNGSPGPGRFRWFARPPRAALTALANGHVHVAGAPAEDARGRSLARYLPTASAQLIALGAAHSGVIGLLVPDDIRDRRITRMRETLASAPFKRALRALGYDTRLSGEELTRITLD